MKQRVKAMAVARTGQVLKVALLAAWMAGSALAEPVQPVLDTPLRDAGVCRGPDGTYYLTGTSGPDFNNNRGVRVWTSKDLQKWEDKGFVWDLWKDTKVHHGAWQPELYPVPGLPPGDRGRAMTAPRIAHDGERFWITFSMNGYAAGAMPGGAEIQGPYSDTQMLAEAGGAETDKSDASIFMDRDGTRYLVWGGGMIAKLKPVETLKKLSYNEVGFEGRPTYLPAQIEGFFTDATLPEHGLPYGVSVVRDGESYAFLYTATTLRDGKPSEDAYIVRASKLLGPYGRPELLLADSGRVTVFTGPDSKPWISYSVAAQPALSPMPKPTRAVATTPPPAPKSGEIVTSVPRRAPSEKPKDVPQLLEMIEPIFDHPLRDAAICRGPDGTWYLTGTEGSRASDGTLDWNNNKGVRLWKSTDRKQWADIGYVWEIERHGKDWQKTGHLDLTVGASPRIGRAITAPEIHYIKNTFYIAYSLNGMGSGLLKSASGKAEGPYEDLGLITRTGRDPSLFVDSDGSVLWVLGPGLVAKMKDDLTGLAEAPRPLFTGVAWYPRYLRRSENLGIWGSHLVKQGEWYVWNFTTRSGRGGINAIDTMASWSKSIEGPWGEPCLMLANGGQSTLVADGDGGWLATVSGEDEFSNHPYRAALTPVVSNGGFASKGKTVSALDLRPFDAKSLTTQFQAVNSLKATALDLWIGHPDFIPFPLRDVFMGRMPDGYYYCTGSFWGVEELRRDVNLFRSKDLVHWEKLPPVYPYAKYLADGAIAPKDQAKFQNLVKSDVLGVKGKDGRIQFGDNKLFHWNDNYYITTQNFGNGEPKGGISLLKSETGKVEGPYRWIRQVPGSADTYQDQDGTFIHSLGGCRLYRLKDIEKEPFKQSFEVGHPWRLIFSEDCEAGILKVDGKYVAYSTDWSGNYDMNYMVADSIEGPWSTLRIGAPYGGNGYMFQHADRSWWYAYFPNTNDYATRAQNFVHMNIYPLFVGMVNGELIIEPKAVRANRAALEKMGAIWQSPSKETTKENP